MKFIHKIDIIVATLLLTACAADAPLVVPDPEPVPEQQESPRYDYPDEYHQKMRTVPYPRQNNELYVNPAPLIVPQGMKKSTYLQFALSSTPEFTDATTTTSDNVAWNMWNPHRQLEPGTWYWRFRNVNSSGTASDWSETYSFTVTGTEPVFVTPIWEYFLSMAPQHTPRYYCFLDAKLQQARQKAPTHPEYASLVQRASISLATDYESQLTTLYANHEQLYQNVEYLYQAYLITRNDQYAQKLIELLEAMLARPCSSSVLYSDNFITSTITYAHAAVIDLLSERLPATTLRSAEEFIAYQCRRFYTTSRGYEENHIFDNHFWQINYRLMFFSALTLYDRSEYPDALTLLEYLYELWTARAPASGFNRDGVWHNGTGYFTSNSKTLAYMPLMLSYITRTDFTAHPWYRNAGQALSYSMPPVGANAGFGDGHEKNPEPNRQMAAFADFLARETRDGYAAWYASSRPDLVHDDWELRIYRMCNDDTYGGATIPDDIPMLTWFKDAGEVSIHTSLTEPSFDLSVGFRSSQYGSGSHTTSSQNAFNLVYGGKSVFCSSGYYQSFSDAHNLLWYRHSRSHNTILVNGIGQPYTTKAYGRMLRAGSTPNIAYALGDASAAYCGFTDDEMWITNFKNAGVEESRENGFGPTPLSKYLRHLIVLQPGIAVIYDDLEATEAADWQWLLHSPVEFEIDSENSTIVTSNTPARNHCRVMLLSSSRPEMSKTSKFFEPPAVQGDAYPDQWHFTAEFASQPKVRVLAIIEPCNIVDDFSQITHDSDGTYTIGKWTIKAQLDPVAEPCLHIENTTTGSLLDIGTQPTVSNAKGSTFHRAYTNSTLIVDGTTLELIDNATPGSRTAR